MVGSPPLNTSPLMLPNKKAAMPIPRVMAPCFLSSAWVSAVMNVHSRRMRSMGSESGPMDGCGALEFDLGEAQPMVNRRVVLARRGLGHGGWSSEAL